MSRPIIPPPDLLHELAAAPALEGRTLAGRYRILEKLGEGGMGTVFIAEQLRLHRRVAVKVLATELVTNPESLERFRREADAMSRLQHPHVVSILDFDIAEDGTPYLVMELLAGETLQQRLERVGALDPREAVRIVSGIASALGAAHAAGVVHRDLKPQNVFLVPTGDGHDSVKLLDFGISKQVAKSGPRITVANALVGSPLYMAPEQVLDDDAQVGFGTDQYALAVIAYELFTGTRPFANDNIWRLMMSTVNDPPPPFAERFGLPMAVERAVHTALAKHPRDRFRNVHELAAGLDAALEISAPRMALADLVSAIDDARAASTAGRAIAAWHHAERAYAIAERTGDPAIAALLRLSEDLLARIYALRLGGLEGDLEVLRAPTPRDAKVSPLAAFLASRLEGKLTIGDVLDMSPFRRVDTLRALARLVDEGILAVS